MFAAGRMSIGWQTHEAGVMAYTQVIIGYHDEIWRHTGGNNTCIQPNAMSSQSDLKLADKSTGWAYFRVTGAPWGRAIIAMAADDVTNVIM